MDDVVEREAREAADQRKAAFREAQRSDSNVYWLRRLKWGAPKGFDPAGSPSKASLGIVELLLILIIVASLGYVAVSLWPR